MTLTHVGTIPGELNCRLVFGSQVSEPSLADCAVSLMYVQLVSEIFSSLTSGGGPGSMMGPYLDNRFKFVVNGILQLQEYRSTNSELPEEQVEFRNWLFDYVGKEPRPAHMRFSFRKSSPLEITIAGGTALVPVIAGINWVFKLALKRAAECSDVYYGGAKARQERESRELDLRAKRAATTIKETEAIVAQVLYYDQLIDRSLERRPSILLDGLSSEIGRENQQVDEIELEVRQR